MLEATISLLFLDDPQKEAKWKNNARAGNGRGQRGCCGSVLVFIAAPNEHCV